MDSRQTRSSYDNTGGSGQPQKSSLGVRKFFKNLSRSPHRSSPHDGGTNSQSTPTQQVQPSASVQTPSQSSIPIALDLWKEARSKLETCDDWNGIRDDVVAFENKAYAGLSSADVVLRAIRDAKDQALKDQSSFTTITGKKVVYRDVLDKILEYATAFGEIGGSLASIDPTGHTSLAWGGVKFFVQSAVNNKAVRDIVLDQQVIAHRITRYAIFEQLYLENGATALSDNKTLLKESIVELYLRILKYQAAAHKYLASGKISHAFHSLTPADSHPIKVALDNIEQQVSVITGYQQNEDKNMLRAHHQQLVTMLENLNDPIIGQLQRLQDYLDNEKKLKVLDWISMSPVQDHHNFVAHKALSGTGKWLLNHPLYLEWDKVDDNTTFWLHGMMGSGKSTLVSIAIQELINNGQRVIYYYCSQTEETRRKEQLDPTAIFRSLIRQLCAFGPLPDIPISITSRYDSNASMGHLSRDECIDIISELLEQYSYTTIIVDALDEYSSEDITPLNDFLRQLFKTINNSSIKVKILLSSRNNPGIERLLRKLDKTLLDVEIEKNENEQDIHAYAAERIEDYRSAVLLDGDVSDELAERVVNALVDGAQGMFKWVELSVQMITRAGTEQGIFQLLRTLPKGLEDLYENLFQSIQQTSPSDIEAISRVLKWMCCAKLPLSTDAVRQAISLEIPPIPNQSWTCSALLRVCRNFVEEEDGCLRLAHQSVNDFLRRKQEFSPEKCHLEIARGCLLHLCYNQHDLRIMMERHGLHSYASACWAMHYSSAEESNTLDSVFWTFAPNTASISSSLDSPLSKWIYGLRSNLVTLSRHSYQRFYRQLEACLSERPTILFAACAYGLSTVLTNLRLSDSEAEERNANGQTALHVATDFRQESIVDILLEHQNCPVEAVNSDGETALDSVWWGAHDSDDPGQEDQDRGRLSIFRKLLLHRVRSGNFVLTESIMRVALSDPGTWSIVFGPGGLVEVNQNLVDSVNVMGNAHLLQLLFQSQTQLKPNTGSLQVCLDHKYPDYDIAISFLRKGGTFEIDQEMFERAAYGDPEFMRALLPYAPADSDPLEMVENAIWNKNDSIEMVRTLINHFGKVETLTSRMVNAAFRRDQSASLDLILKQSCDVMLDGDALNDVVENLPESTVELALDKATDMQLGHELLNAATQNPNKGVLKQILQKIPSIELDEDYILRAVEQLDESTLLLIQQHTKVQASRVLIKYALQNATQDVIRAILDLPRDYEMTDEDCVEILEEAASSTLKLDHLSKLFAPPHRITGRVLGPVLLTKAVDLNPDNERQQDIFELFFHLYPSFLDFNLDSSTTVLLLRKSRHLWPIESLLGVNFVVTEEMAEAVAENPYLAEKVLERWLQSEPPPAITEAIIKAAKMSDDNFFGPTEAALSYLMQHANSIPITQDLLGIMLHCSSVESTNHVLSRKEITKITASVLKAVVDGPGDMGEYRNHSRGDRTTDATLMRLIQDERLEMSEEIMIIVAGRYDTELTRELLKRYPQLEITNDIIISAASIPDQLILLLPLWNGTCILDELVRNVLTPVISPGLCKLEQRDSVQQLVATAKPIQISQETVKHIVGMNLACESSFGFTRSVSSSGYTSLIYLMQHQHSLAIDHGILDWVAANSLALAPEEDVYSALMKYKTEQDLIPTERTVLNAVKNNPTITNSVIKHIEAADWNITITEHVLTTASRQYNNQALLRAFYEKAPPPGLQLHVKLLLEILRGCDSALDAPRAARHRETSTDDQDGAEESKVEDPRGEGDSEDEEVGIHDQSDGVANEEADPHAKPNDDNAEDREWASESTDWSEIYYADQGIDTELILGLIGCLQQRCNRSEAKEIYRLAHRLYRRTRHKKFDDDMSRRFRDLLGLQQSSNDEVTHEKNTG